MFLARLSLGVLVVAILTAAAAGGDEAPPPQPLSADPRIGPHTGLPVPRFESLKFDDVVGREGPSFDHPILWRYRLRGLPVEVVAEDVIWRRVRDPDGDLVWIHSRGLEIRRTGLVVDAPVELHRRPEPDAPTVAVAEPGVLFEIKDCRDGWMRVDGARATGWVRDGALWGPSCG
jgi:SH3-like domain-containing protein